MEELRKMVIGLKEKELLKKLAGNDAKLFLGMMALYSQNLIQKTSNETDSLQHSSIIVNIHKFIELEIKKQGYSIGSFAEKINMTRSGYISTFSRGALKLTTLMQICDELHINILEVMANAMPKSQQQLLIPNTSFVDDSDAKTLKLQEEIIELLRFKIKSLEKAIDQLANKNPM